MSVNKTSEALKKARQDFEARERARFDGLSGRIKEDRREECGYAADFIVGLDEIRVDGFILKEKLPQAWLNHIFNENQKNKEIPCWHAQGDGNLDLKLQRDNHLVKLKGQLALNVGRSCDRCLVPLIFDLDRRWHLHFLPAPLNPGIEFNFGVGDMGEAHAHLPVSDDVDSGPDACFYENDRLDLLAAMLEEIFLVLPAYIRCGDPHVVPNAQGCDSQADQGVWKPKSQEKWVDPRWAGLLEMKDKLSES